MTDKPGHLTTPGAIRLALTKQTSQIRQGGYITIPFVVAFLTINKRLSGRPR
jgi:hypothetical protein